MADAHTYYAAYTWHALRHGLYTCAHCGMLPEGHHPDQRCYTGTELVARLRSWQRTGIWPQPGEVPRDAVHTGEEPR
jgi:hypothetical protein